MYQVPKGHIIKTKTYFSKDIHKQDQSVNESLRNILGFGGIILDVIMCAVPSGFYDTECEMGNEMLVFTKLVYTKPEALDEDQRTSTTPGPSRR
jgi:hypothetical protein